MSTMQCPHCRRDIPLGSAGRHMGHCGKRAYPRLLIRRAMYSPTWYVAKSVRPGHMMTMQTFPTWEKAREWALTIGLLRLKLEYQYS